MKAPMIPMANAIYKVVTMERWLYKSPPIRLASMPPKVVVVKAMLCADLCIPVDPVGQRKRQDRT